ncbi:MAG TPA: FGGY family carbohydrate kinase, partial [Sediminibacterium sp.]|nr:FGGY family carbohydrate kinase [Sediminibacterium sp.]
MLLLGIDIGTSSIKVSVVDAATQQCLASAQFPERERDIISVRPGWAEQSPNQWWDDVQAAILKVHAAGKYHPQDIGAIGISYQMHGLVLVDKQYQVLRNSIIWCDSRAVALGERAFRSIGPDTCLGNLLNSPGNFTAAKLAWVKENEPDTYQRVHQFMLPGDFIALQLTGEVTTTVSALSEGIFWDFRHHRLSEEVCSYFGFDPGLVPAVRPVFSVHGGLCTAVA